MDLLIICFMGGIMSSARKLINVRKYEIIKDGITFPDDASEKDKSLIVIAAIFIDYLWFENF